jgi:transcription elongation GreA/GreB family factor
MSKAEIVEELAKLTPAERQEIRLKLAELDGNDWLDEDDPLTDDEKALIEQRVADLERNPQASIPWAEAEARLKARFGE